MDDERFLAERRKHEGAGVGRIDEMTEALARARHAALHGDYEGAHDALTVVTVLASAARVQFRQAQVAAEKVSP
jgi:hypothetical protein